MVALELGDGVVRVRLTAAGPRMAPRLPDVGALRRLHLVASVAQPPAAAPPAGAGDLGLPAIDLDRLTAAELVAAIDAVGIGEGWELADALRAEVRAGRGRTRGLPEELKLQGPNRSFRNLVIGRIAEDLFLLHCAEPLKRQGYEIRDYRGVYENRDFGIVRDGNELPVNVKVVGTRFVSAQKYVGLEPDDCVPVSQYKVASALHSQPDLVYVDLVEFGLRQRVDGYMETVDGDVGIVHQLLTWYGGRGVKRAQDACIETLFHHHGDQLRGLSDGPGNFRVFSARRAYAVMTDNPRRIAQLSGGGAFVGDPTIHLSAASETAPWRAIASILKRRNGLSALLSGIRRSETREQATPAI